MVNHIISYSQSLKQWIFSSKLRVSDETEREVVIELNNAEKETDNKVTKLD